MKDVTSTSFGLLIAFFLPGLACSCSLAPWSPPVAGILQTFLKAESDVGLFFMVCAVSLILGLQLTVLRWVVYEKFLCKSNMLKPEKFDKLGTNEAKLQAFNGAVDAHYRYHQFWGSMSFVIPLFAWGYLKSIWSPSSAGPVLVLGIMILLEIVTVSAAMAAYGAYVARAKVILS